uniref:Uncharacterized protein n=1 Tax=Arundo donax TaxID=35708 RepID=A0A0A9C6C7_ARUDO
MGPAALEPTDE